MNKLCLSILLCFLVLAANADVELSSSINDVDIAGQTELLGSLTLQIDEDDFANASTEAPIYLRFTLDQNATLSDTLVNLAVDEPRIGSPIYLAMHLISNDPNYEVTAPADTFSIVRWVAGDNEIWIKVQQPSGQWLNDGQSQVGPDEENRIFVNFGISARSSHSLGEQDNRYNLPFNTRNLDTLQDGSVFADAVSTLICANLSGSSLLADGTQNALLSFDLIAFDQTSDLGNGDFEAGGLVAINFVGDFRLARGKERNVTLTVGNSQACTDESVGLFGFQRIRMNLSGELSAASGGSFLQTNLVPGAQINVQLPDDSTYGFVSRALTSPLGNQWSNLALNQPFELNERTLYRQATLTWTGNETIINDLSILTDVTLVHAASSDVDTVTLDWDMQLPIFDTAEDDAPFNGIDQNRRCSTNVLSFGPYTATASVESQACATANRQIITHLTSSSGGFVTELLLRNASEQDQAVAVAYAGIDEEETYDLEAGEIRRVAVPAGATHAEILSDATVSVAASYRNVSGGSPAHVFADDVVSTSWFLYGGDQVQTWDGLAIVNMGTQPTTIFIDQLDETGAVRATQELTTLVAANQKTLALIGDLFDGLADGYRVRADQPLSVLALRGDNDRQYLWRNSATVE